MGQSSGTKWLELSIAVSGLLVAICSCVAAWLALGPTLVSSGRIGSTIQTAPASSANSSSYNTSTISPLPTFITNAVMAKDTKGDAFDPVGITDTFPADQSTFHAVVTIANATATSTFKVIWFTNTNSKMGEFELKSDGSRNLDFTFKPEGGKLPPGSYKVELYANGKLDRTLNFSVQSQTVSSAQPSSTSSQSTTQSKPSNFVSSVTMAQDTQGANKDPMNPTTTFGPNSTFHAIVRTQNAPANTKFKSVWYAVDVGSAAKPNTLIDETELATDGTRNIDFTLAPSTAWPPGSYRVEISVNGMLDTVTNFSVK